MNFGEIQTALIQTADYGAFSSSVSVNDWIVWRYGQVWAAADWPFKAVGPTSLALTGGQQDLAAPADMFKPIYVFDDGDTPLVYLDPYEFFSAYGMTDATSSGKPDHYTFLQEGLGSGTQPSTLYFGPTPDQNYTFNTVYERILSVRSSTGTWVAGPWDKATTTQQPAWSASFHYILVHGCMATGLGYLGSQDAQWHNDEFNRGLAQMAQFYAPFHRTDLPQLRRDNLG